jgi:hypothetical protein
MRVILICYISHLCICLHLLSPCSTWKTYRVSKGAKFATQRKKQATELTSEMIARWEGTACNTGLQQQQQQLVPISCWWQQRSLMLPLAVQTGTAVQPQSMQQDALCLLTAASVDSCLFACLLLQWLVAH